MVCLIGFEVLGISEGIQNVGHRRDYNILGRLQKPVVPLNSARVVQPRRRENAKSLVKVISILKKGQSESGKRISLFNSRISCSRKPCPVEQRRKAPSTLEIFYRNAETECMLLWHIPFSLKTFSPSLLIKANQDAKHFRTGPESKKQDRFLISH